MSCQICSWISTKSFPLSSIYEGRNWIVNHAYPSQIKGWLVLSAKKHREAFHEVSEEESLELGKLLRIITKVLRKKTNCKKEYVLSSNEGWEHLHFHVVPRAENLKEDLMGPKIYRAIRIEEKDSISKKELKEFSELIRKELN